MIGLLKKPLSVCQTERISGNSLSPLGGGAEQESRLCCLDKVDILRIV